VQHAFRVLKPEEYFIEPDYLPRRYGTASYAVVADVARLPAKISDIYPRLTS
jgi:nitric oxide reductase activation protein